MLVGWRILARVEESTKRKPKRAHDDEATQAAVGGVVKLEAADSLHLGRNCEVHRQRRAAALDVQYLSWVARHPQSRSCPMALMLGSMRLDSLVLVKRDELADKPDFECRAASKCDTV